MIASSYTLTGAADWDMLVTIGGFTAAVFTVIIAVLIGVVYRGLPKKTDLDIIQKEFGVGLEKLAVRFETALEKSSAVHEATRTKELDALWNYTRDGRKECQTKMEQLLEKHWEAIEEIRDSRRYKPEPGS